MKLLLVLLISLLAISANADEYEKIISVLTDDQPEV